jgi:hypothetical protein
LKIEKSRIGKRSSRFSGDALLLGSLKKKQSVAPTRSNAKKNEERKRKDIERM